MVIDHELAFVGGLDLCFGRWDQHQHSLADRHPGGVENEIWPGQDFNNVSLPDAELYSSQLTGSHRTGYWISRT